MNNILIIIIITIFLIMISIFLDLYLKSFNIEYFSNKKKCGVNKIDNCGINGKRYCAIDGKCVEKTTDCGKNTLGIQIKGHPTKEGCLNSLDKCQLLNNDHAKCLKQTSCGYCSNDKNQGMCLYATPSGPMDTTYNCKPQLGHLSNNFTMGYPDEYVPPSYPIPIYGATLPKVNKPPNYNLDSMV